MVLLPTTLFRVLSTQRRPRARRMLPSSSTPVFTRSSLSLQSLVIPSSADTRMRPMTTPRIRSLSSSAAASIHKVLLVATMARSRTLPRLVLLSKVASLLRCMDVRSTVTKTPSVSLVTSSHSRRTLRVTSTSSMALDPRTSWTQPSPLTRMGSASRPTSVPPTRRLLVSCLINRGLYQLLVLGLSAASASAAHGIAFRALLMSHVTLTP